MFLKKKMIYILMSIFLTVRNIMKKGQNFFEAYDTFNA